MDRIRLLLADAIGYVLELRHEIPASLRSPAVWDRLDKLENSIREIEKRLHHNDETKH